MTRQTFEQRLVVARVLNRYVRQRVQVDWNRAVLAALEKWIGKKQKRIAH